MKKNYKQRYLQSCFNLITYEKNNLLKFLRKEVGTTNRKAYRLTEADKKDLYRAIKHISTGLRILKINFKGIEE